MPLTDQDRANGRAAVVRNRRASQQRQAAMAAGTTIGGHFHRVGAPDASPAAWLPAVVHVDDFAYVEPEDVTLAPGINWARTLGARERAPFGSLVAEFDVALDRAAAKARAKNPEWPHDVRPDRVATFTDVLARERARHERSVVRAEGRRLERELRDAARELARIRGREAELREFLSREGNDRRIGS